MCTSLFKNLSANQVRRFAAFLMTAPSQNPSNLFYARYPTFGGSTYSSTSIYNYVRHTPQKNNLIYRSRHPPGQPHVLSTSLLPVSVNSKMAGKQFVEMFYNNSLQQYKQHSQQNNIESIQQPLSSHPANILVSVWPKGIQSTQATEQTTGLLFYQAT